MERAAGPIIAICLIIAIGCALWGWNQHNSLVEARAAYATATKNADTAKANADAMKGQLTSGTTELDNCKSQLQTANQRADAAEQATQAAQAAQSAQSKAAGGRHR